MNHKNQKYDPINVTPQEEDGFVYLDFLDSKSGIIDSLPEEEIQTIKQKLLNQIKSEISSRTINERIKWEYVIHYSFAAMVIMFLLLNFIASNYFQPEMIKIETASNEIKEILLPDGSLVILNEESSVEYPISWNGYFNRKIDLIGEAFFNIAKHPSGQEFYINEGKPFSIVVKGTSFNFTSKKYQHKVALESGVVEVKISGKNQNRLLKPGQVAKYTEGNQEMEIRKSDLVTGYSAWKKGKLQLDNHHLSSVLTIITDIYNLRPSDVPFRASSVISGNIPLAEDVDEVIANISDAYEIPLLILNESIQVASPE